MRNIVPQKQEERNIVHLMPPNTAMGWLQRNRPDLLTSSGAINGNLPGYDTVQDVLRVVNGALRKAMPENYE